MIRQTDNPRCPSTDRSDLPSATRLRDATPRVHIDSCTGTLSPCATARSIPAREIAGRYPRPSEAAANHTHAHAVRLATIHSGARPEVSTRIPQSSFLTDKLSANRPSLINFSAAVTSGMEMAERLLTDARCTWIWRQNKTANNKHQLAILTIGVDAVHTGCTACATRPMRKKRSIYVISRHVQWEDIPHSDAPSD